MSSKVKEIYDRRQKLAGIAPMSQIGRFTAAEIANMHEWVREQQTAKHPDQVTWLQLLDSRYLLAEWLVVVVDCFTVMRKNLLYAATPASHLSRDLTAWQTFPEAIQFMLLAMSSDKVYLFDSVYPVILPVVSQNERAWALHFEGDVVNDMDMLIKFKRLGVQDMLHVLLRSWHSGSVKADRARERLCDIGVRCLTLAASH